MALLVLGVRAQEPVTSLLPEAAELGTNWYAIGPASRMDPSALEELSGVEDAAVAVYGGPAGTRVMVLVFQVAEGTAAVRDSWVSVGEQFDELQRSFDVSPGIEAVLGTMSGPSACANVRRIHGEDRLTGSLFPVSMTLCAADPDLLVLVVVSGRLTAPGDLNIRSPGTTDADEIVRLVLAHQPSTPAP